jgi:hypothetical protein
MRSHPIRAYPRVGHQIPTRVWMPALVLVVHWPNAGPHPLRWRMSRAVSEVLAVSKTATSYGLLFPHRLTCRTPSAIPLRERSGEGMPARRC